MIPGPGHAMHLSTGMLAAWAADMSVGEQGHGNSGRCLFSMAFAVAGAMTLGGLGYQASGDSALLVGAAVGAAIGTMVGYGISRCAIPANRPRVTPPLAVQLVPAVDVAKLPLRTATAPAARCRSEDVESASTSAGTELGSCFASSAGSSGEARGCAVCLESFVEGDQQRTLPCFHVFHARCVDNWLSTSSFCPTCRHDVHVNDMTENDQR